MVDVLDGLQSGVTPTYNGVPSPRVEHRDRIELRLLPAYSPDCSPIERVWWHLHETVTRNHRCKSMRELLDLTFA